MLEVAADNVPACTWYESEGFREIDRRSRYYPGNVDALVLAKSLTTEEPR